MFTKHEQSRLIHLLLYISTARGTILDDSIEERRQNITSRLCPFTDLCHTKASRNFTYPVSYSSCCSDCNCEDDCTENDSCCPDKVAVSGKPSKRVCKTTMVKNRFKESEFHDGFIDGIKNYLIIDHCPAAVEDLDIQERCQGLKKTTLDDYMWVSDTSTGEIFQNYHCAKCHGINDWGAWNIRTQCNYLEDTSFVNMTATLYSDDCNIINEAPDDLVSKTNKDRCFTPYITVCNQTGLWTEYDEFIDAECQRNTVPYFQNNFLVMDIYKNIFCYVCNAADFSSADLICPARDSDTSTKFPGLSVNALIDFTGRQKEAKANDPLHDQVCAFDQVHDKYMGKCRKLICPFGSGPTAGQCRPLTVAINNLGVRVLLEFTIDWQQANGQNDDNVESLTTEDGKDISEAIYKALKLRSCTTGYVYMYKNNKTDDTPHHPDGIFDLCVRTNVDCQYEWLHGRLDSAIGKIVNVTLQHHGHISVHLRYSLEPHVDIFNPFYAKIIMFCRWLIVPSETYCPKIRLTFSDVQSLHNEKAKHALVKLFDGVHVNETSTANICLSEYYRIMSQTDSGIAVHWEALLLTPSLLLASILSF